MTVGTVYNYIQKIEELKNARTALIGSRGLMSMFLGKEDMEYLLTHNNIRITEKSTDEDKEIYEEVEKINKELEALMKIEL